MHKFGVTSEAKKALCHQETWGNIVFAISKKAIRYYSYCLRLEKSYEFVV